MFQSPPTSFGTCCIIWNPHLATFSVHIFSFSSTGFLNHGPMAKKWTTEINDVPIKKNLHSWLKVWSIFYHSFTFSVRFLVISSYLGTDFPWFSHKKKPPFSSGSFQPAICGFAQGAGCAVGRDWTKGCVRRDLFGGSRRLRWCEERTPISLWLLVDIFIFTMEN